MVHTNHSNDDQASMMVEMGSNICLMGMYLKKAQMCKLTSNNQRNIETKYV